MNIDSKSDKEQSTSNQELIGIKPGFGVVTNMHKILSLHKAIESAKNKCEEEDKKWGGGCLYGEGINE